MVVPWYASRRAIAFQRRCPRAAWYWRASFQAASTASEPPETKNPVEVTRREPGHLGGELDRARVRERPVDRERQLAHLRGGRLTHLLAEPVADVHAEQARERVEVAPARGVLEVAAVAADDDLQLVARAISAHLREVQPEMVERVRPHRLKISCG